MILFGNPDYYPRFGFKNAKEFKITTNEGMNFDPFMALELQKNGLAEVQGKFFLDESAEINEQELLIFEEQFPVKKRVSQKLKSRLKPIRMNLEDLGFHSIKSEIGNHQILTILNWVG